VTREQLEQLLSIGVAEQHCLSCGAGL
jgi:hypothetical protein